MACVLHVKAAPKFRRVAAGASPSQGGNGCEEYRHSGVWSQRIRQKGTGTRYQERTALYVYMLICKRDYFQMCVTGWHFGLCTRSLIPTFYLHGDVAEETKRRQIKGPSRARRGRTPRNDRVDSAPLLTRSPFPRISMVRFSCCCCYMTLGRCGKTSSAVGKSSNLDVVLLALSVCSCLRFFVHSCFLLITRLKRHAIV